MTQALTSRYSDILKRIEAGEEGILAKEYIKRGIPLYKYGLERMLKTLPAGKVKKLSIIDETPGKEKMKELKMIDKIIQKMTDAEVAKELLHALRMYRKQKATS